MLSRLRNLLKPVRPKPANPRGFNSFSVESREEAERAIARLPRGSGVHRADYRFESIQIREYASLIIEGNPNLFVFSEMVAPLEGLHLESARAFQYIAPQVCEGPIPRFYNRVFPRLPNWLYRVTIATNDVERILTVCFWSNDLMNESDLRNFLNHCADWSLAEEFFF